MSTTTVNPTSHSHRMPRESALAHGPQRLDAAHGPLDVLPGVVHVGAEPQAAGRGAGDAVPLVEPAVNLRALAARDPDDANAGAQRGVGRGDQLGPRLPQARLQ